MKNKNNKKIFIIIVSVLILFVVLFFSTNFLTNKLKGTINRTCSISSQIENEKSNIKEGEILAEIKDDDCYIKFDTDEVAKMSTDSGIERKYNVNVIVGFKDIYSTKKIVVTLKEGLKFTENYNVVNDSINVGNIEYDEPIYYYNNSSGIIANFNSSHNVKTGSKRIFYVKDDGNTASKVISFNFTVSLNAVLDFSSITNGIKIELFENDNLITETFLKHSEYKFNIDAENIIINGSRVDVYFNAHTTYLDKSGNYISNASGSSIGHETYHTKYGARYVYLDYIKAYFLVPKSVQYMGLVKNGGSVWDTGVIYKDPKVEIEKLTDTDETKFNETIEYLASKSTIIDKEQYDLYSIKVEKIYSHMVGISPSWKYIGSKDDSGKVVVIPLKYEYKTYGMYDSETIYNNSYKTNIYNLTDSYNLVLPADGKFCNSVCKGNKLQAKDHTVNEYSLSNIVKEHMDVSTPLGYYFYNNISPIPASNKVLHYKFYGVEDNKEISNINVDNIKLVHQHDYKSKRNGETYEIAYRKKTVTKNPNGDINVSYSNEMITDVHIILNKDGNSYNFDENYNYLLTREKVNKYLTDETKKFKIDYVDENGNVINDYFHELMYYIGEIPGNFFTSEGAFQWSYVYNGTLDHRIQEKLLNDSTYQASFMNYFRIEDRGFFECEKNINNLSSDKKSCTNNSGTYVATTDTLSKVNVILATENNNSKYIFRGYVENKTSSNDVSYLTGKTYDFKYLINYYNSATSNTLTFTYNTVIYIKDVFYIDGTDFGFGDIKLKSMLGSKVQDENFIDNFNIYRGVLMGDDYYIVLVPKNNLKLTKPMLGFKDNRTSEKYTMELSFKAKIPINYSSKEPINYFKDLIYVTSYDNRYNGASTAYYNIYSSADSNKKTILYKVDNEGKATNEEIPYAHYALSNTAYRVISIGDINSQMLGKTNDVYFLWEEDSDNINTFDDDVEFKIDIVNSTGNIQKLDNEPLEVYIPIPKKNKNLLSLSLNKEFTYDTYLKELVKVDKKDNDYEVYYANVENQITSNKDLKEYKEWLSLDNTKNLDDINFIKIVVYKLEKDENISISFSLKNTRNSKDKFSQYFTYLIYRSVKNTAGEIKEGWVTGNTIGIENKYPVYKVTVKHLDKNNNEVGEKVVKELQYLSDYSLSSIEFSDYLYRYLYWERNGVRQNTQLDKITVEQDEEIIIRYSTLKKVAINYVDEKNNPLRKPIYIQGYDVDGALFEYIPDKIDSYILNSLATNKINSNFNGKALTIDFSGELPEAYYIVYSDLPGTFDNIVIYILIFICSLSIIIGIIIFNKKKQIIKSRA